MKINIENGLLEQAEFILSPNSDDRPSATEIDLLVIHNISLPPGQFGGPHITQLFSNQLDPTEHPFFEQIVALRVSSHLLIRRDGDIIQYVPFNQRAWHAGVSEFNGKTCCNDFSIGIEMEGTDDQAYEEIQYQKLSEITEQLFTIYPKLSKKGIKGHCDIAAGRKTDPGKAFDWSKYLNSLQ